MDTKRIFAADIGASGGKCFVGNFSNKGFDISEIHRFTHEVVPLFIQDRKGRMSERMYWNDLLLYQNILQGLQYLRREVSSTIEAIGIDTWGTDGCLVTEEGDFLGRVYCYRDHRLDTMIEEVKKHIEAKRLYEITGIYFWPFNLSGQLFWFFSNRKELYRPGCFFLPMPTVFYFYLGGIKKIDSTWASVSQLMDARRQCWSAEVLMKLGIPEDVMPTIVPPGTVMGRLSDMLSESLDLNPAKLVSVCSHDTASAYAAAPVENTDEALIISSGTWSIVGRLIPEPITTPAAMEANISNEGGIGNIRFLKNCMGTWIVQELRRGWKVSDGRELGWEEMLALVTRSPAFSSFIDPDSLDFYNPPNMEKAIVDFCKKTGQSVPGDRGTFLRVVYESLALKYRTVNEVIASVCGKPTRVIHIVGGGSKNQLLNQFTANATGLPVVAGPFEATAVGNIMVQAIGLGIISDLTVAIPLIRQAFNITTFRPQNADQWSRQYDRFLRLLSP
jgi:rhamnulokinase